jgi:hypothetical protein
MTYHPTSFGDALHRFLSDFDAKGQAYTVLIPSVAGKHCSVISHSRHHLEVSEYDENGALFGTHFVNLSMTATVEVEQC